jgi:hypothetical protein
MAGVRSFAPQAEGPTGRDQMSHLHGETDFLRESKWCTKPQPATINARLLGQASAEFSHPMEQSKVFVY